MEELEKDRSISRESWKGKKINYLNSNDKISPTKFTGYESISGSGKVLYLLKDQVKTDSLKSGENGCIVLDSSSFYGESGGQIGDTGYIKFKENIFLVEDTQKENDVIIHIGKVIGGYFSIGMDVNTEADEERRKLLTFHHSGTHLMHGALRRILGNHVSQKASLVSNDYLRFDFSHPAQMKEDEILKVEEEVNLAIEKNINVNIKVYNIEDAKKTGAIAFFEEKYGENVRVVQMGDFSSEFCGGCHVSNTSQIGFFMIVKESSPGAGNRRIEALCGTKVIEYFQTEFQNLKNTVSEFNLKTKELVGNTSLYIKDEIPVPEEINKLFIDKKSGAVSLLREKRSTLIALLEIGKEKIHKVKKRLEEETSKEIFSLFSEIEHEKKGIGKFNLFHHIFDSSNIDSLKELGDSIKNKYSNAVIFFVNKGNDSDTLLVMAGKEAIQNKVNSGDLLKKMSNLLGGRGGGKLDLAQGSSKEKNKYPEVLNIVIQELEKL